METEAEGGVWKKNGILIVGDHVDDVFFYPIKTDENKFYYNFGIPQHYRSIHFNGGVHLIGKFLGKLVNDSNYAIKIHPDDKKYITREILKKYPPFSIQNYGDLNPPIGTNIFRGERFLGVDQKDMHPEFIQFDKESPEWTNWEDYDDDDIILYIINDIGKKFREDNILWTKIIKSYQLNPDAKVILKLNPHFDFNHQDFAQSYINFLKKAEANLIIIINLKDLRFLPCATISYQLSWEKTTEELLYHLQNNPEFQGLRKCKQLVIRLGLEGVLVLNEPSNLEKNGAELFFDPFSYEDAFLNKPEGNIQGISIAFLSGLVSEWILSDKPSKKEKKRKVSKIVNEQTIESGLNLAWNLWIWGYGGEDIPSRIPKEVITNHLEYRRKQEKKLMELEEKLKERKKKSKTQIISFHEPHQRELNELSSVKISIGDLQGDEEDPWTILLKNREMRTIGEIAYDIVRGDIDSVLLNFPVLRIGNLITVDRREIESYRSVKNIINEYLDSDYQKNPLSIAVFGPPGSGKSFGVKQLLGDRGKNDNIEILSFNLSQFTDITQLNSAFHKIRDSSLLGKLPVVFFDEFDCKFQTEYGWIKYFLAPMQDGGFFDGETSHPLGRAIFVFAGGLSSNYSNLYKVCKNDANAGKEVKDSKIKDFISRLRGYIDITGCDPDDTHSIINDDKMNYELFKIKRGIVLRSLLLEKAPQIVDSNKINIDSSVLRAFIKVNKYKHGVRSMQSIIEMSNLKNKTSFEPSSLPAENQLNLHVNAKNFNNLLLRDIHFKEASPKIVDYLSGEHEKILREIGIDYPNYNQIKTLVDKIPSYLHELRFGFYKIESSKEEDIIVLPISESPNYSSFTKSIKIYKTIEKFLKILPDLMKHAQFQMYKI